MKNLMEKIDIIITMIIISTMDKSPFNLEERYIAQLNENERKTLEIARQHLESSFDLEKSLGFQQWLEKNKTPAPPS